MELKNVIERLEARGIRAGMVNVEKNGVQLKAVQVWTDTTTAALFYIDRYSDLEELFSAIEEKYPALHKTAPDSFDATRKMTNEDYVKEHIFIGLRKDDSNETLITRESILPGIFEYLYLRLDGAEEDCVATTRMTKQLAQCMPISIKELWEFARANTYAVTTMFNMASIVPCSDFGPTTIVVSNKFSFRGAANIMDDRVIQRLEDMCHDMAYIILLPSSIHEVLLVVVTKEDASRYEHISEMQQEFDYMVQGVNSESVSEEEQLADHAYILVKSEAGRWEVVK